MMDEMGDSQQSQYSQCMSEISSESYIFVIPLPHGKLSKQFCSTSVPFCYAVKNIIHEYKMHEYIFHEI